MEMKGLSTPLKIVVVMLILLIVGLIILLMFSGGMENVDEQFKKFFDWLNGNTLPECSTDFQCDAGEICDKGKCVVGSGGSIPGTGNIGDSCTLPTECSTLNCVAGKCVAAG